MRAVRRDAARRVGRLACAAGVVVLLVLAGCGGSGDNAAPVARLADPVTPLGETQRFYADDTILLDASGSTDADGDALAFEWRVVAQPIGSAPVLSTAGGARATLVAGARGRYVVQLRVSDGREAAERAVALEVGPTYGEWYNVESLTIRLLDAGPDLCTTAGSHVQLAGSLPNPAVVLESPQWRLTAPAGSAAALSGAGTASPSFFADVVGRYALVWRTGYVQPDDAMFAYYRVEDAMTVDVLPPRVPGTAYRSPGGLEVTLLRTRRTPLAGGLLGIEADLRLRNPGTEAIEDAPLRLTTGDGVRAHALEPTRRRVAPGDAGAVERTDRFIVAAGSTPMLWAYDPNDAGAAATGDRLSWCAGDG
jgi:hypothetical protein